MAESLRWGILGTGAIAARFAEELEFSRTGRLVAVASRSGEALARFVARHPGAAGVVGYHALLEREDLDAVYLSMPHPMHAEWSIAAARAGKHILCEKPAAMNARQAEAVFAEVRRAGVFFMEAFMYRCHPRTERVVELVREGAVGEVRGIEASFCGQVSAAEDGRLLSEALGGGGIMDVGCYCTSVVRLLAGAEPVEVTGAGTIGPTGVDVVASGVMAFEGGMIAVVNCAMAMRKPSDLIVYGTQGQLHVPKFWCPPGPIRLTRFGTGEVEEIPSDPCPHKYALEADVVAAALPGVEAPAVTWEDTLGNLRAMDRWRAAVGMSYPEDCE